MSIKFKQNGQWVKIPTPSQIDDSAASAATTYSSNKINEIIPQDIAKYLLEHKDELGTDDFTKLKNVPFTTINTTNKPEFTTLKGILDHPDGMYLVDDCGVTNGDEQLTIASFKGHCSTMLMASIAQFQKIVDSDEIKCYKGSTIYILTDGNISNNEAIRYVSICNIPMGVSGEGEPSSPDRTFPDAGTSIINIEIHPVEDRSSGMPVYSYDIDGGTQTLFTHPGYASILTSYANELVSSGFISGKSSYSPNQLVKIVEDTDSQLGYIFTGVDASEFKSPFTIITNENATNYNTLDKLCHLDDGLYLCKDTYKTNQDYIVDITFKGIDIVQSVGAMYGGTELTPESTTVRCKNGCLISVSSITSLHKNIRITQSAEETNDNTDNELFGDIYISAQADSGNTENPVYGVTGDSVNYIRPFNYTSLLNTYSPSAVLGNAFGSEAQKLNGKLAKWQTSGSGVVLTGADGNYLPIIEINDGNFSSFNTLQKWMNANAGTYLVKTTKLTVEAAGIDQTRESDNSFSRTLGIPSDTYVYVYSTDESNSSATNYKNVVFQKADNMPSGYYGEWMIFQWDTRKTYSADNVEFFPLMTAVMNGAAAVEMVNELSSVIDTKVDAAYVTNALDARADKFQENESTSVVLNNHTEYRCKVMASLNLSLPETIPDDYNSRIVFESGETATTLSYTAGSIKFTGDDCDNSNAFVPAKNTSYEVDIKYLGLDSSGNKRIIARVGAF